ncbi:hypothetical protein D3C81_2035720 [compost metagenome]
MQFISRRARGKAAEVISNKGIECACKWFKTRRRQQAVVPCKLGIQSIHTGQGINLGALYSGCTQTGIHVFNNLLQFLCRGCKVCCVNDEEHLIEGKVPFYPAKLSKKLPIGA